MEELLRNWRAIRSIAGDEGLRWMEYARRFYIRAFALLVVAIVIAVAVAVWCNFAGVKGAAFVIVLPFLVVWVFCQFYPAVVLTLFGVGTIDGLPKDWSLNRLFKEQVLPDLSFSAMVRSGFEFIKKITVYGAQAALFAIVTFVVLGSWDLANPKAVLPILVILAGFGIMAALYPPGKPWYRWVVTGILLAALAQQLWDAYVGIPAQKEVAKAASTVGSTVKGLGSGLTDKVSGMTSGGETKSSVSTSTQTTQACQGSVVLETVYTPSESKGPKLFGKLVPGRYGVSATGMRGQQFFARDLSKSYTVEMDPDGRMPTRGNVVWKAGDMNPEIAQPFVGESYGAFIIRAAGEPHLTGSSGTLTLDRESNVEGDINVFQNEGNYGGHGSIQVTITRCG